MKYVSNFIDFHSYGSHLNIFNLREHFVTLPIYYGITVFAHTRIAVNFTWQFIPTPSHYGMPIVAYRFFCYIYRGPLPSGPQFFQNCNKVRLCSDDNNLSLPTVARLWLVMIFIAGQGLDRSRLVTDSVIWCLPLLPYVSRLAQVCFLAS